jgi:hypothetical protein
MTFDQIAIYTPDLMKQVNTYSNAGFSEWTFDVVTAVARVMRYATPHSSWDTVEFRAKLAFNYQLMDGVEYELIAPFTSPNYIERMDTYPNHIAHLGVHVEDQEEWDLVKQQLKVGDRILQECWTLDHENEAVPDDRSYRYAIFRSEVVPQPVKLIMRVPREDAIDAAREAGY